MEQKLAEFRARRAKVTPETNTRGHCETRSSEDKVGRVQAHTQAAFRKLQGLYERWKPKWRLRTPEAQPDNTTIQAPHEGTSSRASDTPEYYTEPSSYSLWTVTLLLKFLLWLVLLGLFVELEFGLAYFVLSMFYWLYEGTRGPGARRKGEKSAYSVFNPGCEAIEGTLTAEQFERELQYRPMAGL
ncbi:SAYSvFN domain-containing protein 1 [Xenopus laevis]|uniref:SAYSvFN domain-containing protein 1 n=2 Tax=Xenopus laevis TaxID=8355 RepID=A0A1L8G6V1_XENLA|nr:SAYSvFN domain-containing protein 1 [Xenopus laevis]XP_018118202.1 SAYSvFN domain-containing protein 1 [Xenopus laevis]OCT79562.1 hypothetical protein XELAEV_18026370mg [Xenopus laevis]